MRRFPLLMLFVLFCAGCIHVTLAPVEAHITVDVNVKVDKALDDFFGDIDRQPAQAETPKS